MCLALIIALSILPIAPSAQADHFRPIQPGAKIYPGPCTFNTVWEAPNGTLYIGAAAHCVPSHGRVSVLDVGEMGSVVYWNYTHGEATPWMDYALIQIDADKHHMVDPALRFWGGPTGTQDTFIPGMPVVQYGHGVVVSYTEATRPRSGILEMVFGHDGFGDEGRLEGWFLASFPALGGDSGSLILTAEGKALGITIGLAPTWGHPGVVNGPTFELIQQVLARDGHDLEMLTAPLTVADPSGSSQTDEVAHIVEQCTARIVHERREDHCLNTGNTDWTKPDPAPYPRGELGEVLWEGSLLWGGPYTYTIPLVGYLRLGALAPGTDSDMTGDVLPSAGSYVATRTSAPGGAPYDIDLYFWPGGAACATTAPDEICRVPDGATRAQIAGYAGVAMDVTLHEYVVADPSPL